MKNRWYLAPLLCIAIAGCDANVYFPAAADAVDKSEPVVTALEDATGKPVVSEEAATKGEQIASGIAVGAKTAGALATALGQPLVGGALAGFSVLAASIAGLFKRRAEKYKKVAKTVMKSVDDIKDVGKAITSASIAAGVADDVEAVYREP